MPTQKNLVDPVRWLAEYQREDETATFVPIIAAALGLSAILLVGFPYFSVAENWEWPHRVFVFHKVQVVEGAMPTNAAVATIQ